MKTIDDYFLCYRINPVKGQPAHTKIRGIYLNNEFGPERTNTVKDDELCVPSIVSDLGISEDPADDEGSGDDTRNDEGSDRERD